MRIRRLLLTLSLSAAATVALAQQTPAQQTPQPESSTASMGVAPSANLRVLGSTMDRQRITAPLPVYPEDAKAAGIGGVVRLNILISPTGTVQHAEVTAGSEELRAAATEAITQWTFQPYLVNGQPATVETTEAFKFNARTGIVTILTVPTGPVRVSAGVMAGLIVTKVTPAYPLEAKKAHITGAVVMRATISKDGGLKDVEVVSGPDLLKDAALNAAKQWKYKPYLMNGEPVEVDTQITINFALAE